MNILHGIFYVIFWNFSSPPIQLDFFLYNFKVQFCCKQIYKVRATLEQNLSVDKMDVYTRKSTPLLFL